MMKTKYSPVLKIKEQKVNDIEMKLFNVRATKSNLELELESIETRLNSEEFPKSGSYADLQIALAIHEGTKDELTRIKEKIALVSNQIFQLENAYKEAFKDKEKIKYLHDNEVKNAIKRLEHKSQSELDELAVMGHFRRHKNEDNI